MKNAPSIMKKARIPSLTTLMAFPRAADALTL